MHVIIVATYCGWLPKEDVDDRNVLFISIVVRLPDKALNDLLTLSPGDRVVASHWTLYSSHIVWKAAMQKVYQIK